jgi:threonine dehydrogenase-like Zn-dependent dehydrogenase
MAGTSLAAVMTAPKTTELREIPLPDPADDSGLLRVVANGICGSDVNKYKSDKLAPAILGHEIVGYVEALGATAKSRWGVKEGDYVALEEYLPCGHCAYCRSGEYRSCVETDIRTGGIRYGTTPLSVSPSLYGGHSRYLYLHPRTIFHKIPNGIAPHVAAMALPLGNGFQWAYLDGEAGPEKTIVVVGPGQQGFGCIVAAAAAGAQNVVIAGLSRHTERFEIAKKLGATHAIALDQGDPREEIRRITGGKMADTVIDVSSAGPEIINAGIALLKKRGQMLCTAYKKTAVPLDIDRLIQNQAHLSGTRGHSFEAVEIALQTMKSGKFPLDLISTHVMGLNDVDHALRMVGGELPEKSIHVTIEPWR